MCARNFQKYLCFSKDITLATRLIAFIGIAISVLLMTVLLNDTSVKNFHVSRKIALALGLDWRHIHSGADTSPFADPEGKIISGLLIFYIVLFFLTNVSLFLGAILENYYFAVPWLICEFLGCLSKIGALIFHIVTEGDELNKIFIIGSIVYLLVMLWWWLVVYTAQSTWKKEKQSSFELSSFKHESVLSEFHNSTFLISSPQPYRENSLYTTI